MYTRNFRFTLAFLLSAFTGPVVSAAKADHGTLTPARDAPADWVAQAKAAYPADYCVVSEDKLGGEMGPPVDYIYKAVGKPDRLVRFCCKDCVKDFNKDPDKYLGEIDKAAAKKAQPAKDTSQAH